MSVRWFNRGDRRRGGLQLVKRAWTLQPERCPCDIHFTEWVEGRAKSNETIFHFGTGIHHYVGKQLAGAKSGTSVLGITATVSEHDSYVELVSREPALARNYIVLFGDIYLTNQKFLPLFDVVTLFHLCEFRTEANDAYGALTDAELLEVLTSRTKSGGYLLFYRNSYAEAKAQPIIDEWAATGVAQEVEGYKSLRIFRRT